ncbi:MAG: hypothetical protein AB7V48_14550 [Sedimentibacter sp.]
MYEMRQKKINEMRQKKWFNYALLAVAIFIFSQSSSIIKTNMGFALPLIIISFVLHSTSVGKLTESIFKIKSTVIANIAMVVALSVISVICYFNPIKIIYIILLDFAAIAVYVLAAFICSKLKTGE